MELELRYIDELIKDAGSGKKIILYGSAKETGKLVEFLKLYNLKIAYVINDVQEDNIRSVFDLMYEKPDDIFVLICKINYLQACSRLEELGLRQQVHFRALIKAKYANLHQTFPLDVNIGYTSSVEEMDARFPGVTIFGDIVQKDAYKVVTLGGSTSDSQAFVWKCWSEFLWEKLNAGHKDAVVISAGVSGYRSSQEFLKLVRDMIGLKPDMVVSFSGVNDTGETDHPFVQYYMDRIFGMFCRTDVSDINGAKTVTGYSAGFSMAGSLAENWVRHMRMMKAVCTEFGISFHSFLQPMIGSKKSILSRSEREQILNGDGDILERTERFLLDAKNILGTQAIGCIHDISDLFDKETDVYIDACHVTEEGNRKIADKIYEVIHGEIPAATS